MIKVSAKIPTPHMFQIFLENHNSVRLSKFPFIIFEEFVFYVAIGRSDVIQKPVINVENRLKFSIKPVRSISCKTFTVG